MSNLRRLRLVFGRSPTARRLLLTGAFGLIAGLFALVALLALPGVAHAAQAAQAAADGSTGSDTGAFQRALTHGTVVALAASYGFGVATSLTPCVYPMIAITVSVFGAREAKSRLEGIFLSLSFVAGIVCLFTPMGVLSALTGRGFGSALGNGWVVAGIALVFLALAASLFGAFELELPSSLNNRLSTVGGAGPRGAFILGLVCGLVAAPCVGPFLFGLLGWIATTRNVLLGSSAMAFYGIGLGTLFFLVGAFAVNLPKAGAWMVGIKWVGGVALATMALGYVRDALPRATVHSIAHASPAYLVAGAAMLVAGIGMAGIHVAAERRHSEIPHLSLPMKLASILPAVAGAFMVVSWTQIPKASAGAEGAAVEVRWESNEAHALARVNSEHKPLLVDFGAAWCGACKELDEKTFPDARVRAEASRFVALHVDATDDDDPEVARVRGKYGAKEGLPVVLLFGSDGKENYRFTEFVPPDRLAAALQTVQ